MGHFSRALRASAEGDDAQAYNMWILVFPILWAALSDHRDNKAQVPASRQGLRLGAQRSPDRGPQSRSQSALCFSTPPAGIQPRMLCMLDRRGSCELAQTPLSLSIRHAYWSTLHGAHSALLLQTVHCPVNLALMLVVIHLLMACVHALDWECGSARGGSSATSKGRLQFVSRCALQVRATGCAASGLQISLAKPMLKLLEKECHARQQTMRPNVGQVPRTRNRFFVTSNTRRSQTFLRTQLLAVFYLGPGVPCTAADHASHHRPGPILSSAGIGRTIRVRQSHPNLKYITVRKSSHVLCMQRLRDNAMSNFPSEGWLAISNELVWD